MIQQKPTLSKILSFKFKRSNNSKNEGEVTMTTSLSSGNSASSSTPSAVHVQKTENETLAHTSNLLLTSVGPEPKVGIDRTMLLQSAVSERVVKMREPEAGTSTRQEEKFQSRFKELFANGEVLKADSSAVMTQLKVLLSYPRLGHIYVTDNYLCFFGDLDLSGPITLQIAFTEITKITGNGLGRITLRTESGKRYAFTVIRHSARDTLEELWQTAKGNLIEETDSPEEVEVPDFSTVPCGCSVHYKNLLFNGVIAMPPAELFAELFPNKDDGTTLMPNIWADRKTSDLVINDWNILDHDDSSENGSAELMGEWEQGNARQGIKQRLLTFLKALPPTPFGTGNTQVEETQTILTSQEDARYVAHLSCFTPNLKVVNTFKIHYRHCISREAPTSPSEFAWSRLRISVDLEFIEKLFGPLQSIVYKTALSEMDIANQKLVVRVKELADRYANSKTGMSSSRAAIKEIGEKVEGNNDVTSSPVIDYIPRPQASAMVNMLGAMLIILLIYVLILHQRLIVVELALENISVILDTRLNDMSALQQ